MVCYEHTPSSLASGLMLFLLLILGACQPVVSLSSKIVNPITISSIYPQYINTQGTDAVTFTGEALNRVKAIKINNSNCRSFTRISSNQISCLPPSNNGVAAFADVTFVTDIENIILDDALTYTLIIGQPNSTSYGNIDKTFNAPYMTRVMANKYFVVDTGNNRVYIWNSVPISNLVVPDLIIGQVNSRSQSANFPTISGATVSAPTSVWTDGTKLAIADFSNNRILLWHSFPNRNAQPADIVLGQPDFVSNTSNNGPGTAECGGIAGVNACSISTPIDVIFEEDKLIVTDAGNNRLLIWDGWPTSNQRPADHVIGQPSFVATIANNGPSTGPCGAAGRNACSFHSPQYMAYHSGKLLVADYNNNRILIFNNIPLSHGTAANLVLGQANFTTNTSVGPSTAPCGGVAGVNSCSLNGPKSVTTDGTHVYVADFLNHRVLGWSTFPISNQQPADIVLGQSSFTTAALNDGNNIPTASSFNNPHHVNIHDNQLWVTDRLNNRVLRFSTLPASFASADFLLGHTTFSQTTLNQFATNPGEVQLPAEAIYDGTHLIIADRMNNRVTIKTGLPTSPSDTSNTVVLGQPNLSVGIENNGPNTPSCGGVSGRNACSLNQPMAVLTIGSKLLVSDFNNNRVLIWNSIPTTDQQPADIVLGQPNFTAGTANNGPNTAPCGGSLGRNRCSFSSPIGMTSDGTNLIVNDYGNNRILIWNSIPISNQQPADLVLGQPGFITGTSNNGPNNPSCDNVSGRNRCSLHGPYYIKTFDGKLIVTDQVNHRVLVWNSIPTVNQAPADVVIGQPDFTTSNLLRPPTGRSLTLPRGICVTNSGRLIIGDQPNNRIVVLNQIPLNNGPQADLIIGQDNETAWTMDGGKSVAAGTFSFPTGIGCYGEHLFVPELMNARIQYFPIRR